jgi:hypothetical protein
MGVCDEEFAIVGFKSVCNVSCHPGCWLYGYFKTKHEAIRYFSS